MIKFNDALLKINEEVLKKYPTAAFYEAQGYLIPTNNVGCKVDGTVNEKTFKSVYTLRGDKPLTIFGTLNEDGTVKIEEIYDIWMEDVIMTPYVPLSAEYAIELLCKKYGNDVVGEGPIVLRHQLFYGEPEPRYFFGTFMDTHTVNVYTERIDVPAGHDKLSKTVKKVKNILKGWFF